MTEQSSIMERSNDNYFSVVVRVRSFFSLLDGGPKTYFQSKSFSKIVGACSFNFLELVDFIGADVVWGSAQYITFWRSFKEGFIEIKSDDQLLEWCGLNRDKRVVHIEAQINDFEGPLQFSPTKRRCHPTVRKRGLENPPLALNSSKEPIKERSTKKKATKKVAQKPKRKRPFDDEEAVGVDDENKYSDSDSLMAASDSSYDTDLAASSDSESDSDYEADNDHEIFDEDDEDDIPPFAYDADDPCADEGVVFPDVKQCKAALTHHAILNDYAFQTLKKDNTRFRAECKRADKGCKWRFFASISKKSLGCKVKLNSPKHTCGSVNMSGHTMGSENWVAERVVDWLREKPTLTPMELQHELKLKYKFEVPYYRVFKGKEKALDMIYGKWDESYALLPTYRAELLRSMPGSIVEIDIEEHNGEVCFRRFFVALRPCIDGFLQGCRPYIAMDSTKEKNSPLFLSL